MLGASVTSDVMFGCVPCNLTAGTADFLQEGGDCRMVIILMTSAADYSRNVFYESANPHISLLLGFFLPLCIWKITSL